MARDHARIRLSIWGDPDFRVLTSDQQRLYFLVVSQPGMTNCGVVPYTVRRWAALAGDTTERGIRKGIAALQGKRYVLVDEDTEELLIRSFVRHDGILSSPNISVACAKAWETTHSPMLRAAFQFELHRINNGVQEEGWEKGWPRLQYILTEPLSEGFDKGLPEGFLEGFRESRAGAAPVPDPDPFLSPVTDDSAENPSAWAAGIREQLTRKDGAA